MLDRGYARLAAWIAATTILILTLYSNQLFLLTSGLDDLLSQTLGTVFPAYPFLVLLVLLTAIRWKDFHSILLTERGITTRRMVRLVGLTLALFPALVWTQLSSQAGQSTYPAMEVSASSLVLVAYGMLLATNPSMWRIMLPYASLYAVGLISPLFMLEAFGAPFAALSSYLAAGMTNLIGLHIVWQGVSFAFVSRMGESISSMVTPVCSAAYSISIYLALLGLMYLDIESGWTTLAKFAVVGVAVIPVLDSVRIALTIWAGVVGGSAAFWGVHDWLGYAIFFAFYVGTFALYSRSGGRSHLRTVQPLGLPR